MRDKKPIENKIPTRRKDTKKRIILDRNQVKEKSRSKVSKLSQEILIETNIYGGDIKFQLIPIEGT